MRGERRRTWGDVAPATRLRMSRVQSKNTTPEKIVHDCLESARLEFETHARDLPGKPDFVFRAGTIALFVNGCFWHGHSNCRRAALPKRNAALWAEKIHQNSVRDRRVRAALRRMGWSAFTIWECQVDCAGLRRLTVRLLRKLAERRMDVKRRSRV